MRRVTEAHAAGQPFSARQNARMKAVPTHPTIYGRDIVNVS